MNPKRKVQNESTKGDPVITDLPAACADERLAVEFMEQQRWGDKPYCPRCGDQDVYQMKDSTTGERQADYRWRCRGCKEQFTARIGTVFEDSRAPLRHWCFVFWRAATSKKGVSALEVHRQTGLSYKTCLFMLHRVRCAMDESDIEPLQGTVEVDEVFIGGKPRRKHGTRHTVKKQKATVVGMLERNGRVRPKVVADVSAKTLKVAIAENVDPKARIMTDDWSGYRNLKNEGWNHESVKHSMFEYVRGDVHTNSIEGFFGMLKRGLNGIYHSISKKHLHRYLSEFQFRHNRSELTDGQRTVAAIKAAQGKRLTYAEQVGTA
ncbi:MAG: IS1595 family transposase [Candidatus Hydrogenedentes bacterium]|nr:IS1595 family transposase [Candidatus Hydrogenedentota bacterium]